MKDLFPDTVNRHFQMAASQTRLPVDLLCEETAHETGAKRNKLDGQSLAVRKPISLKTTPSVAESGSGYRLPNTQPFTSRRYNPAGNEKQDSSGGRKIQLPSQFLGPHTARAEEFHNRSIGAGGERRLFRLCNERRGRSLITGRLFLSCGQPSAPS